MTIVPPCKPMKFRLTAVAVLLAIAAVFGLRAFGSGLWEAVGLGIMLGGGLVAAVRSRISLPSMFLATFWIAVCIACYAIIQREHQAYYRLRQPWSAWVPENVLMLVMMVSPFLAAASFFGRTMLGVVIGVLAISAFWLIFYLA